MRWWLQGMVVGSSWWCWDRVVGVRVLGRRWWGEGGGQRMVAGLGVAGDRVLGGGRAHW